ncbi:MerR family DNA-binding transcriptional regulator, partial [Micromonospora sp. D75]|uniref:MerR family DNA-binding transcriptional regulator n=1 Tax=Micromonospora sp. D75 TaxID=2824885 RepID=UPI001FFD3A81
MTAPTTPPADPGRGRRRVFRLDPHAAEGGSLGRGREGTMAYTVGQVARAARVTVRTLHHYDEIGLL